MAADEPAAGTIKIAFVDESGNALHETESVAVPRVGDEVMIAAEPIKLGAIGWAKAVVGMLKDDDIHDPTYREGKVVKVIWCLMKNFGGQFVTVVVKLDGETA
jgi:hypothetical protein